VTDRQKLEPVGAEPTHESHEWQHFLQILAHNDIVENQLNFGPAVCGFRESLDVDHHSVKDIKTSDLFVGIPSRSVEGALEFQPVKGEKHASQFFGERRRVSVNCHRDWIPGNKFQYLGDPRV
jgi:hypothetical protein